MMDNWFKAKGKVQYTPWRPGATKRAHKPWVTVNVPNSIAEYYRAQIVRNLINPFNQDPIPHRIHPPKWGAHITVLDGRFDIPQTHKHAWEKHQNAIVEFEYSNEVEQVWKFFVLPVRSAFLESIRAELGLPPRPLHITVGRIE